jgi:peptidoglycan/xylan/chitin deacetylase (PgdA/CDA1 family)
MTPDLGYPWPDGRRAAVVMSVDFDGPTPFFWRHRDDDRGIVGELEQRRFGPRQGVWRLLEIFAELDLHASFYVPGAIATAHRDAVAEILAGGHEVGLHGDLHEQVDQLDAGQLAAVMQRAEAALRAAGATGPLGYRSPSWEMTQDAWDVLETAGVAYDSSLMGYEHPYRIGTLIEVPVAWTLDDAIFYRYTAGTVRPPVDPATLMASWDREIAAAKHFGSLAMLTVHPWLSGRGARALALGELLRRHRHDPDLWWATTREVAAHHATLPADHWADDLRPEQL